MFDRGVTDLYFTLNQPRDSIARSTITIECDDAAMVSDHGAPCPLKVYTHYILALLYSSISVNINCTCYVLGIHRR